jgi:hypothetical protein
MAVAAATSALADGTAEDALIPLEQRADVTTFRLHTEPPVLVVPLGHRLATRPARPSRRRLPRRSCA